MGMAGMAIRAPATSLSPATRVVVRVVLFYAVVLALGALLYPRLPDVPRPSSFLLEPMLGAGSGQQSRAVAPAGLGRTVLIAMGAAILLSLPVAWVYQLTRAKRGYQQSVVQLLIILPLVVSGIVVLVKDSLALAFGLAGIVAAVRFRNTLDDSKDAVYVFLATGVGLAAAVDVPVAAAISFVFNATVLTLWYADFGNSPVELEGRIAARRLQRAKQLARTGTFVAQIDNEVLRNMTREQLEGLAQRALRRAHDGSSKGDGVARETVLRMRTKDLEGTRRGFELVLGEFAREWRAGQPSVDAQGIHTIDYVVHPKKATQPDELLALARMSGGASLVDAQIR